MKIHQLPQRSEEWFEVRRGKITGTVLKRILGTAKTKETAYWELLADRLSVNTGSDESDRDRGERLESEAIQAFEAETGKIVDRVGFIQSDENEFIGCSPDGLIENKGVYDEGVEVKCLSSREHIRAWLDNKVPDDYYPQVIQQFIVNTDLKKVYFVLYDPRVRIRPIHIIEVEREEVKDDIEKYKQEQISFIETINNKINDLITI